MSNLKRAGHPCEDGLEQGSDFDNTIIGIVAQKNNQEGDWFDSDEPRELLEDHDDDFDEDFDALTELDDIKVVQEAETRTEDEVFEVPPPPLDALPSWLGEYVSAVSVSYCVESAMVFAALLATASSAIGRAADICLEGDWKEIAPLWIAVVAPPGSRKSPTLAEITGPMTKHEADLLETHEALMRGWEADNEGKKGKAKCPEPRCQQAIVGDVTIEALASVLEICPRVLSVQDELKGLFDSMGAYKAKSGQDRTSWLSLHAGSRISINRKGFRNGKVLVIKRPRLGLIGCTTPASAAKLMQNDLGDGMLDRLFFVPVKKRPYKYGRPKVGEKLRQKWHNCIKAICDLPTVWEDKESRILSLSSEAEAVFGPWSEALDARDIVGYMNGTRGKLAGHCGRIALTLTIINNPSATVVSGHQVECAIRIAEWLFKTTSLARQKMLADYDEGRGTGAILSNRAASVKRWMERNNNIGKAGDVIAGCKQIENKEDMEFACNELEVNKLGQWDEKTMASGRKSRVFILKVEF